MYIPNEEGAGEERGKCDLNEVDPGRRVRRTRADDQTEDDRRLFRRQVHLALILRERRRGV